MHETGSTEGSRNIESAQPQPAYEEGVVHWFDDRKGQGYIMTDPPRPNGRNVGFYALDIVTDDVYRTIREGDKIRFEVFHNQFGHEWARNVTKLS